MTIKKRFHQEWIFECPEAVLTCSVVRCEKEVYLCFGGHDKNLYFMDLNTNIIDDISFDGWCRCSFSIDLNGDGCDEILVGSGDGSFFILKFDKGNKKLIGLKHYKSGTKIICCTAGTLYKGGEIALIVGCEDKTLRIFKSISSEIPDLTLYYDSWVTSVCTGFLKLQDSRDQVFGILVGTKSGLIQFVQIVEDSPEILWQSQLFSQINDIKVGDVTNNGFNEIIACTDDSYAKILNGDGEKLCYVPTKDSRPVSALIEDIDGDNAQEILIGCADGSLMVFHNPRLNSQDFLLKWKANTRASIKTVCSFLSTEDNVMHVVFGGYDRTLRNIYDFEQGIKPILNVPSIQPPKFSFQKSTIKVTDDEASVPTSLREYITSFLKKIKKESTLDGIKQKLLDVGYTVQEIEEEIRVMIKQNILTYEKVDLPVFTPDLSENQKIPKENQGEDESEGKKEFEKGELDLVEVGLDDKTPKSVETELDIELEKVDSNLKEDIISYLKENNLISSKMDFIEAIAEKGYDQEKVEQKINSLKENGIIKYSRSAPRGWSLKENMSNSQEN